MRDILTRTWDRLRPDTVGLVLGAVFFVLALTPSLLPRDLATQGLACGLCAGTGYMLGTFLAWCWRAWARTLALAVAHAFGWYPTPRWSRWRRGAEAALSGVVVLTLNVVLLFAVRWQGQVAALTGSRAYSPLTYLLVFPVGFGVWMALVWVGRGFLHLEGWLRAHLPQRLPVVVRSLTAWLVTLVLVLALVLQAVPGVLTQGADLLFSGPDATSVPDLATRPTVPERSGSPASPVAWETVGFQGRAFLGRGLDASGLEAVTGRAAREPVRVYAGLASAPTDEARAALVVQELERTGAADRRVVMIAPTTGTGWVDPTAALSLEVLYDGDTAIAAAQYSYLPSWVQFIADPDTARSSGRALVEAVVAWWRTLPEDHRPRLLLYGESLGVVAGEAAFGGLADLVGSVDGVLWVGPPRSSRIWDQLVARRDPGTTQANPVYSAGMTVRFAQDRAQLSSFVGDPTWTGRRILFIQHASDPVVWWSPDLVRTQPDWLQEPAGADRSPSMVWMPYITFFQVSMDLARAADVPHGHGHNYGTEVLTGLALVSADPAFTAERIAHDQEAVDAALAATEPADG